MKAYKFRMYPTKEQKVLINKTLGSSRFIYNHFLGVREEFYHTTGKTKTAYDCCSDIKILAKEYPWLKEVDSCALRCAVFDLDNAFKKFFKNTGSYPKFKSRNSKRSYRTNNMVSSYKGSTYNSIKIDLVKKEVILPKLKGVKIKGYRNLKSITGNIINATVSKENDRYYVSIVVNETNAIVNVQGQAVVGIDLGIKTLVTTSDFEKYDNQKVLSKYEKRLTRMQRQLSRKEKGSKNYYKCLSKINVIYRKIKNTRKYYLHEISKYLTDNYKIIVTETLKIKNMLKNHKLSKSISDCSWYELIRQLEYKSKNKGVKFYQVDTYYPSSQKCSCCGYINKKVKDLNLREYTCEECGCKEDRDYNAALNIMSEGINLYTNELIKI